MIAKELGRGIGWFDFSFVMCELLLGQWWPLQVKIDLDQMGFEPLVVV